MTSHDTFLELAATAIDFPLAHADRNRLEQHLAACPACSRSAHAFRGDALAFGDLPAVTLPDRRGAEILRAAMHPATVRHPLRLVLVAALLALLALGSLVAGAQLLWRSQDDLSVVPPAPTATPGTDASASAGTDATPAPEDLAKLAWVRQGDPPGSAPMIVGAMEIVGFTGGYVARHQAPGVYFSPDGRAWQEVLLPPLDIKGAREPYIVALASSGAQVLAVGGYGHDPCRNTNDTGSGPACAMSPMAWVTDDGVTWRPSDPWAPPAGVAEPEGGAEASAAWAVPGGWEAARISWEGEGQHPVDIWRSAEGITWERVAALESPGLNTGHGVAVAEDGTRVRWDSLHICPAEGICPVQSLLRTSADGATWTELGTFPGADVSITRVAPPIPGQRSTWVVAGTEIHFDEGGGIGSLTPRIWTSSDLSTWTAADLEVPDGARSGIYGLTWSHDRLVAVDGTGLTWVSPDGSSWTLLADRRAVGLIADGPAGIIGMPEPGWDGDEGIWLLGSPAAPTALPTPTLPAGTAAPPAPTGSPTAGASGELVAVLDVRCGPGAPELGSDRVRASGDGVRIRVTGEPGWHLGIEDESRRESVPLETAVQELVLGVAPGNVTIDCGDPTLPGLPPASKLQVEDPDNWYRPMSIGNVVGSCVSGSASYGNEARGRAADPVRQAQELLRGLRAGDVVERGGYATDKGWVRVVRADEVIGVLEFNSDGHGGWLLMGSTLCGNLSTG